MMLEAISPSQASLERLQRQGILLVQYPPMSASQAELMLNQLVAGWGLPHLHDAAGRQIWNVRRQPQGRARSQGLDEFRLHTDASFEDPPPRYVALFVVTADARGGGCSLWVSAAEVLARLSSDSRLTLQEDFRLRVPEEFYKDRTFCMGPLHCPPDLIRYRGEVVVAQPHQQQALADLELALQGSTHSLWLPAGSLLLLDNWRFFHGRTPVLDPQRHLLRMRFFGPHVPPAFGVARLLPRRALPASAYLPGSSQARPHLETCADEAWEWGVDLFNHGYYWEAHEAWESLWQAGPKDSPSGLLLRALIQAAAACIKALQNNRRGLELLRRRALQTLSQSGVEHWRGLSVQAVQRQLMQLRPEHPRLFLRV